LVYLYGGTTGSIVNDQTGENEVFLYFISYFQWREIVRDYQFESIGKSPLNVTFQHEPDRSFQDSVGQQFGLTEVVLSISLGEISEYHEIGQTEHAKKIPRYLQSPDTHTGPNRGPYGTLEEFDHVTFL
jgi:hypothetical protein